MPEAARTMQAAARDSQSQERENSQSPESRNSQSPPSSSPERDQAAQQQRQQEEVAQASKEAREIQEALEKTQQKGNQDLDQLQALTLAQRLRKVGGEESGLSGQLTTNLADTIGLPARDLPDPFKNINTNFVRLQDGVRDESAALQGEISRFFERTQKTNYGRVSQDMKDTHATNELERMSSLIQNNITIQTSLDLTNWAGRFQSWADELQPKSDSSSGGQSQGGQSGEPPKDLTKQLIALLRLREEEMSLRDQTKVLDAAKQNAPDYQEQAATLSGSQEKLAESLEGIHKSVAVPQFDPPFQQTSSAMNETQGLLRKPQTDTATDAAEGKTVDDLSDLINLINELSQNSQQQQQQQPGQSSESSAEEMAFLKGLMENSGQDRPPMTQPVGGGNWSGGATDKAARPATGNMSGPNAAARNIHKAAGAIDSYPVEFRDALQNYFHGVETPAP
jgi:hypothetical protein